MTSLKECRICYEDTDQLNLIIPCGCKGSLKYAHIKCIVTWIDTKPKNFAICELCKYPYSKTLVISRPRSIKKYLLVISILVLFSYISLKIWTNKYYLFGNYWTNTVEQVIGYEPINFQTNYQRTHYWAMCLNIDPITAQDEKRYEYCENIEKISPMDTKKINCETTTMLGFKNMARNCNCIDYLFRKKVLCVVQTSYLFQINYGYYVEGKLYPTRNVTGSCTQNTCNGNIFRPMRMKYSNDDYSINEVQRDWISSDFIFY